VCSSDLTVPASAVHRHKDGAVFRHRDMVISVIDLKGLLGLDRDGTFYDMAPKSEDSKESHVFIILRGKTDSRQSILADEILGQQKIVIKEFELETFRKLPYFNGLTLLGDGRVVLILDSDKLLES
jgi:chemotaxis protein histidine kinase CheA